MDDLQTQPTSAARALAAELATVARTVAGTADGDVPPSWLSTRSGAVVVRVGGVVVKAHPEGTRLEALRARVEAAAHPRLGGIMLPPLRVPEGAGRPGGLLTRVGERLVTAWPAGDPVDPDMPELAPWEPAARLLASLHATPAAAVAGPGGLPPAGGPARVARALDRLRTLEDPPPAAAVVLQAAATLPSLTRATTASAEGGLVHGDWHLGQLVSWPAGEAGGGWRLIDVEDLGGGDPAWDLARPAAWFAAGLLPGEDWERFLQAYRAAGGPALPSGGDLWSRLELPARALTVQVAATAVAAAGRAARALDEEAEALVAACARMATLARGGVVS